MTEIHQDYATALFSLAKERGADWSDDLRTVAALFRDNPAYAATLASPAIPLAERIRAVAAALGDSVATEVSAFVRLLCERGHIRYLEDAIRAYIEMEQDLHRRTVAQVVSAAPLTDDERERLLKKLERVSGRTVTLECTVDPTLLGGAIVRVDGKVLDGTLQRRLRDMKEGINR